MIRCEEQTCRENSAYTYQGLLVDTASYELLLRRPFQARGQGSSTKFPLQRRMSEKLQPGA